MVDVRFIRFVLDDSEYFAIHFLDYREIVTCHRLHICALPITLKEVARQLAAVHTMVISSIAVEAS